MADVHEPEVRSYNMSRIKGKDTKPEMLVRKYLHSKGFRYNLHGNYKGSKLPGKPDIVLPKYRTVIFVHGCFWHGHKGCKYFKIPKTRTEFWTEKINGNIARDQKHYLEIKNLNWNVVTVWECELKPAFRQNTLQILPFKIKISI